MSAGESIRIARQLMSSNWNAVYTGSCCESRGQSCGPMLNHVTWIKFNCYKWKSGCEAVVFCGLYTEINFINQYENWQHIWGLFSEVRLSWRFPICPLGNNVLHYTRGKIQYTLCPRSSSMQYQLFKMFHLNYDSHTFYSEEFINAFRVFLHLYVVPSET